ncbi:FHA domain-containing protein [Caldanaerobius polysaccharolyticus]|uniref:FHA domain-containing protein n=1 Tax=Caldanaerobius polysaccharolyticus TaxID=44256 RepID=UPI00047EFAD5|nr:FHA domain-containing protein [Caldanaerobius polysaccharolyticus]
MYNFIAWVLRFVFIIIIYYFLYNVLKLLYMDIRGDRSKKDIRNVETTARIASLKPPFENYTLYNVTTIGRADDCDVILKNEYVSSKHAQIYKKGGKFWVDDLKSTNGTFVNGRRIKKPVRLKSGDIISIANEDFRFSEHFDRR